MATLLNFAYAPPSGRLVKRLDQMADLGGFESSPVRIVSMASYALLLGPSAGTVTLDVGEDGNAVRVVRRETHTIQHKHDQGTSTPEKSGQVVCHLSRAFLGGTPGAAPFLAEGPLKTWLSDRCHTSLVCFCLPEASRGAEAVSAPASRSASFSSFIPVTQPPPLSPGSTSALAPGATLPAALEMLLGLERPSVLLEALHAAFSGSAGDSGLALWCGELREVTTAHVSTRSDGNDGGGSGGCSSGSSASGGSSSRRGQALCGGGARWRGSGSGSGNGSSGDADGNSWRDLMVEAVAETLASQTLHDISAGGGRSARTRTRAGASGGGPARAALGPSARANATRESAAGGAAAPSIAFEGPVQAASVAEAIAAMHAAFCRSSLWRRRDVAASGDQGPLLQPAAPPDGLAPPAQLFVRLGMRLQPPGPSSWQQQQQQQQQNTMRDDFDRTWTTLDLVFVGCSPPREQGGDREGAGPGALGSAQELLEELVTRQRVDTGIPRPLRCTAAGGSELCRRLAPLLAGNVAPHVMLALPASLQAAPGPGADVALGNAHRRLQHLASQHQQQQHQQHDSVLGALRLLSETRCIRTVVTKCESPPPVYGSSSSSGSAAVAASPREQLRQVASMMRLRHSQEMKDVVRAYGRAAAGVAAAEYVAQSASPTAAASLAPHDFEEGSHISGLTTGPAGGDSARTSVSGVSFGGASAVVVGGVRTSDGSSDILSRIDRMATSPSAAGSPSASRAGGFGGALRASQSRDDHPCESVQALPTAATATAGVEVDVVRRRSALRAAGAGRSSSQLDEAVLAPPSRWDVTPEEDVPITCATGGGVSNCSRSSRSGTGGGEGGARRGGSNAMESENGAGAGLGSESESREELSDLTGGIARLQRRLESLRRARLQREEEAAAAVAVAPPTATATAAPQQPGQLRPGPGSAAGRYSWTIGVTSSGVSSGGGGGGGMRTADSGRASSVFRLSGGPRLSQSLSAEAAALGSRGVAIAMPDQLAPAAAAAEHQLLLLQGLQQQQEQQQQQQLLRSVQQQQHHQQQQQQEEQKLVLSPHQLTPTGLAAEAEAAAEAAPSGAVAAAIASERLARLRSEFERLYQGLVSEVLMPGSAAVVAAAAAGTSAAAALGMPYPPQASLAFPYFAGARHMLPMPLGPQLQQLQPPQHGSSQQHYRYASPRPHVDYSPVEHQDGGTAAVVESSQPGSGASAMATGPSLRSVGSRGTLGPTTAASRLEGVTDVAAATAVPERQLGPPTAAAASATATATATAVATAAAGPAPRGDTHAGPDHHRRRQSGGVGSGSSGCSTAAGEVTRGKPLTDGAADGRRARPDHHPGASSCKPLSPPTSRRSSELMWAALPHQGPASGLHGALQAGFAVQELLIARGGDGGGRYAAGGITVLGSDSDGGDEYGSTADVKGTGETYDRGGAGDGDIRDGSPSSPFRGLDHLLDSSSSSTGGRSSGGGGSGIGGGDVATWGAAVHGKAADGGRMAAVPASGLECTTEAGCADSGEHTQSPKEDAGGPAEERLAPASSQPASGSLAGSGSGEGAVGGAVLMTGKMASLLSWNSLIGRDALAVAAALASPPQSPSAAAAAAASSGGAPPLPPPKEDSSSGALTLSPWGEFSASSFGGPAARTSSSQDSAAGAPSVAAARRAGAVAAAAPSGSPPVGAKMAAAAAGATSLPRSMPLRQRNQALLDVLERAAAGSEALAERLYDTQLEVLELRAAMDVQQASYDAEVMRLRRHLRRAALEAEAEANVAAANAAAERRPSAALEALIAAYEEEIDGLRRQAVELVAGQRDLALRCAEEELAALAYDAVRSRRRRERHGSGLPRSSVAGAANRGAAAVAAAAPNAVGKAAGAGTSQRNAGGSPLRGRPLPQTWSPQPPPLPQRQLPRRSRSAGPGGRTGPRRRRLSCDPRVGRAGPASVPSPVRGAAAATAPPARHGRLRASADSAWRSRRRHAADGSDSGSSSDNGAEEGLVWVVGVGEDEGLAAGPADAEAAWRRGRMAMGGLRAALRQAHRREAQLAEALAEAQRQRRAALVEARRLVGDGARRRWLESQVAHLASQLAVARTAATAAAAGRDAALRDAAQLRSENSALATQLDGIRRLRVSDSMVQLMGRVQEQARVVEADLGMEPQASAPAEWLRAVVA